MLCFFRDLPNGFEGDVIRVPSGGGRGARGEALADDDEADEENGEDCEVDPPRPEAAATAASLLLLLVEYFELEKERLLDPGGTPKLVALRGPHRAGEGAGGVGGSCDILFFWV